MISVVIPVYNRPASALRAARSALSQVVEGQDIEVLLVDDASQPPLDAKESERMRVIRMHQNAGPAAARNRGIEASRGEFIAFLDSDDVWLPGKLAAQMAELNLVPDSCREMTGVTCGFYYPQRGIGHLELRMPIAAKSLIDFASGCWIAPGTALLISRRAFEIVGPFDANLRRLEDFDWLLRFALAGGRIEVAHHHGAVIAPSGLARAKIVMKNIGRLQAKYARGGCHQLEPSIARRFAAYLALEEGAARLADRDYIMGGIALLRSLWLKPRLQGALLPFWNRSTQISVEVQSIYRNLTVAPT